MLPCPITKAYFQSVMTMFRTGWSGLYRDVLDDIEELEEAVDETSNAHDLVVLRGFLCIDALIREVNILEWRHPTIGNQIALRTNSWEALGELLSQVKELKEFSSLQQVEYELANHDDLTKALTGRMSNSYIVKLGIRIGLLGALEKNIEALRPALKVGSSAFSKLASVGITTANAIQDANRPQHLQMFLNKLLNASN